MSFPRALSREDAFNVYPDRVMYSVKGGIYRDKDWGRCSKAVRFKEESPAELHTSALPQV